ncbi:MAG: hypothetical protein A2V67_19460 [Deltaproteobacteria bacterium RBG_13_61_14]|nr:MAG: hypothetical protein A2V67_19460 [Deltaproteobacteria bacterium RBG_13_61_14]
MLTEEIYALNLTLLGMGTVFFCLALLYVFFAGTGRASSRYSESLAGKKPASQPVPAAAAAASEEFEVPEEVVAAIALALAQARPAAHAGAAAAVTAEVRVSAAVNWREQGRLLQHRRSSHWEQR